MVFLSVGLGSPPAFPFLNHKGTILSDETDEERTCLLGGGAGRSSDRLSYQGIDRASVDCPSLVDAILYLDHRVRQMDRKRTKPLR